MTHFVKVQVTTWAILILSFGCSSGIIVQTRHGFIRGTVLTSERSNRDFFAFMGVPYAKPPVGSLRFKAPQPADSWVGIKPAIIEGPVCPQVNEFTRNAEGDEDCLFLNVYTSKLPSSPNDTLLPVMVSIHGGSFSFGSGDRVTQGPDYLVDAGVVVVTFNYRLGLLGFLSLQNAEVPGNNGLKDQVLVLKWIQRNIAQFGGDPNNVTIFGISAGGACTNLHMLSPMSRGLFHRAISQSGSAFMPLAYLYGTGSLNRAFEAAQILSSNATSTEELWQELKNASIQELWPVIRQMSTFRPTRDAMASEGEVFLPDDPKVLVNNGYLHNVPFMAGFTSNEGLVLLRALGKNHRLLINSIEMLIRNYLRAEIGTTKASIREAISKLEEFYFEGLTASNGTLQQNLHLISDTMFVNGLYCAALKQTEMANSSVYLYQFSFSGNMSLYKILYGYEHLTGASHADDLPHIYRTSFVNRSFAEDSPELITSRRIVTMWTNFAKTGNPTPVEDPLLQNITWRPVTKTETPALNIGVDLSLEQDLRKGSFRFWEELYRNYTSHPLCG